VGGFVRDMLLCGRGGEFASCHPCMPLNLYHLPEGEDLMPCEAPQDIDLVTSDPLETFLPTIQKLSDRYHVVPHYEAVEFGFEEYRLTLTRLRYDAVCDGRQADVVFVDTLQEDVWRRDFTINALYADAEGQVVDFVGGYWDLKQKKVRFIGDPAMRIKEDVLRILRYVRFCSLLNVSADPIIIDLMRPYLINRHPRANEDLFNSHNFMGSHFRENDSNRWQCEIKKIQKFPLGQKNLDVLFGS